MSFLWETISPLRGGEQGASILRPYLSATLVSPSILLLGSINIRLCCSESSLGDGGGRNQEEGEGIMSFSLRISQPFSEVLPSSLTKVAAFFFLPTSSIFPKALESFHVFKLFCSFQMVAFKGSVTSKEAYQDGSLM